MDSVAQEKFRDDFSMNAVARFAMPNTLTTKEFIEFLDKHMVDDSPLDDPEVFPWAVTFAQTNAEENEFGAEPITTEEIMGAPTAPEGTVEGKRIVITVYVPVYDEGRFRLSLPFLIWQGLAVLKVSDELEEIEDEPCALIQIRQDILSNWNLTTNCIRIQYQNILHGTMMTVWCTD